MQEGKPIYGGDNDHSMDDESTERLRHTSLATTTTTRTFQPRNTTVSAPSSLAKAAGGCLPVRKPHISTKLVVNDGLTMTHTDENDDDDDSDAMAVSPPRKASHHLPPPPRKKASPVRMRLVIGGETQNQQQQQHTSQYEHVTHPQHLQQHHQNEYDYDTDSPIERMEGVEHHGPKGPLVVMDGANVAYAYADAMVGFAHEQEQPQARTEPDARGIQVAANYFLSMDVRVLVVIPAPWFRSKPRAGDESHGKMILCCLLVCGLT